MVTLRVWLRAVIDLIFALRKLSCLLVRVGAVDDLIVRLRTLNHLVVRLWAVHEITRERRL